VLQNLEETLAGDAAEAVTARAKRSSFEMDLYIVPVREGVGDGAVRRLVRGAKILQGCIGEDDAPAERIQRPIALQDSNAPIRESLLDQDAEVQTSRSSTQACNAQLPHSLRV
jgi:hypothetical protein